MSARLYIPSADRARSSLVPGLAVGGVVLLIIVVLVGLFLGSPDPRVCSARMAVKQKTDQMRAAVHDLSHRLLKTARTSHCHRSTATGAMTCHRHVTDGPHDHKDENLGQSVKRRQSMCRG
jgi:hypothetical protein